VLQRCLLGVSRVFQGCFEGVSRAVQGSFKDFVFRRKFQGCVKSMARLLNKNQSCVLMGVLRIFKGVPSKIQRGFKRASRKFQGCFMDV